MSGETNRLLGLAHEVMTVPDAREMDVIAAFSQDAAGRWPVARLARLRRRPVPAARETADASEEVAEPRRGIFEQGRGRAALAVHEQHGGLDGGESTHQALAADRHLSSKISFQFMLSPMCIFAR